MGSLARNSSSIFKERLVSSGAVESLSESHFQWTQYPWNMEFGFQSIQEASAAPSSSKKRKKKSEINPHEVSAFDPEAAAERFSFLNETDSDFEDPRVKKKKKKKSKKSSRNKDDSSDNSTIQYASDVFGNEMTSPTKRTVAGSQSQAPKKTNDSTTTSKTNALPDNF